MHNVHGDKIRTPLVHDDNRLSMVLSAGDKLGGVLSAHVNR